MKKFIYLSIALVSLSLVSCREQEAMDQILNEKRYNVDKVAKTNNVQGYTTFNAVSIVN